MACKVSRGYAMIKHRLLPLSPKGNIERRRELHAVVTNNPVNAGEKQSLPSSPCRKFGDKGKQRPVILHIRKKHVAEGSRTLRKRGIGRKSSKQGSGVKKKVRVIERCASWKLLAKNLQTSLPNPCLTPAESTYLGEDFFPRRI